MNSIVENLNYLAFATTGSGFIYFFLREKNIRRKWRENSNAVENALRLSLLLLRCDFNDVLLNQFFYCLPPAEAVDKRAM